MVESGERRGAQRIAARLEIRFGLADDAARAFKVFSANVSPGGLCVRTRREYDVGQELRVHLRIGDECFELLARVVWTRHGAMGMRFLEVPDAELVRLAHLLAAVQPALP